VSLADPRVSPDGSLVAFTVTRVDLDANRYRSAVWLAATDGASPPRQLTSGEHGDSQPRWSPDGRRLAFTSRRSTGSEAATLHVVPVDGPGETITLCERPEAIEEPAWSPDGRHLAFASRERTGRYADGDDERARPPRRIDRLWSRIDGTGWTIDRPRSLFVVPADGFGAPRLVAGGPYEHSAPTWSPDGGRLLTAAPRAKDWDLDLVSELHVVDLGTDDPPTALTATGRVAHDWASWSPDGSTVASLAGDAVVLPTHYQVVLTDVGSGEQRDVQAQVGVEGQSLQHVPGQ